MNERDPRRMIEMSELDVKVCRSALGVLIGYDPEVLIALTRRQTPGMDPDDVTINCLTALMVAKDLHTAMDEVLKDMEENPDGD